MEEYLARLGIVDGKKASGNAGVVGVLADLRFRSIIDVAVVPFVPFV